MKRLNEIGKEGFGNKAFNLAKLHLAGFNVKDAVVIGIAEVEDIVAKQIVSKNTIVEIEKAICFGSHGVAVRSTALGEDSDLSWAGQFKTRLFVKQNELADAIIECANARNSETVKAYAKVHSAEIPFLALIIQEMVDAEVAGVLFTINPVTKADEIVVEVVSGVGESLVSGSRQPVRYYLSFENGGILRREGNETEVSLSQKELCSLSCIAREIYDLYGEHQDIEWAIERRSRKIFVNQSRDVTAIGEHSIDYLRKVAIHDIRSDLQHEQKRLEQLDIVLNREDILSNQNIAEIITPHPCRMAFGLFVYEFAHGNGAIRTARNEIGYDIGPELETGFFQLIGGKPHCSIIHDAFTYRIKGIPLKDYCLMIDYYLERIAEDPSLANYPEVVLYNQNPSLDFLNKIFGKEKACKYHQAYKRFFIGIRVLEGKLDWVCRDDFLPRWKTEIERYCNAEIVLDLATLTVRFKELCDLLRTDACPMFVKAARLGFFAYARLRKLLTNLFDAEAEKYLNALTSGISPELNPVLRFNIQLAALRDNKVSLQEVVKEFGHLAPHELEILIPRYNEQPHFFQKLAGQITEDPLQDFKESADRSLQLKEQVLTSAGTRSSELAQEIDAARTYLPLREVVKFAFLRAYEPLRETAVEIGKLLGWEEGLIFHLDPREVFTITTRTSELHKVARERYRIWKANKALFVPPVIDIEHLEQIGSFREDEVEILRGIGVTNFATEGEVVVIRSLNEKEALDQLRAGSILVTVTTDPAWTPLLSIVGREGGLVTEIGGLLAHGAIYAREVGMAAVLNVQNATHVLKTGMRVRVNGQKGCVEILS